MPGFRVTTPKNQGKTLRRVQVHVLAISSNQTNFVHEHGVLVDRYGEMIGFVRKIPIFTDRCKKMIRHVRKMPVFTDGCREMIRFVREIPVCTDTKEIRYDETTD